MPPADEESTTGILPPGAFLAELSFQLFGYASYLMPATFVIIGWNYFWCRSLDAAGTKVAGAGMLFNEPIEAVADGISTHSVENATAPIKEHGLVAVAFEHPGQRFHIFRPVTFDD